MERKLGLFNKSAKGDLEFLFDKWRQQQNKAFDDLLSVWDSWVNSEATKQGFIDERKRLVSIAVIRSQIFGCQMYGRTVSIESYIGNFLSNHEDGLYSGGFEDYKEKMWSRLWNIYKAETAQSWNEIMSSSSRLNKALNGHAITVEVGIGKGEIKGLFEKDGKLDFDKWKIKLMGELRFMF